jgi:hypothetical protein
MLHRRYFALAAICGTRSAFAVQEQFVHSILVKHTLFTDAEKLDVAHWATWFPQLASPPSRRALDERPQHKQKRDNLLFKLNCIDVG